MTPDDIIRMAREVGFNESGCAGIIGVEDFLERFAALFAAHEREACAKVCEEVDVNNKGFPLNAKTYAAAIRARGEE